MAHFLISFPSAAMDHLTDEDLAAASQSSREVIREAKAAGFYVFGGAIDEGVDPVTIAADGAVARATPETRQLTGGFLVLTLPSREAAEHWAAKVAAACRCDQELRQFHLDPES